MAARLDPVRRAALQGGMVIPAHPLALDERRRLDVFRQRALTRYYSAAGAGGIALGVHTTQFAIRDPRIDLFRPVLELGAETMDEVDGQRDEPLLRVAGICGPTAQAVAEAELGRELGYHLGLLSLAALREASEDELIDHARAVGEVQPLCGFYLQPAVGGRILSQSFWRRLAELEAVVAIKVAPFDRYRTLEVLRGVEDSGRAQEIALYTGNDDHIAGDLAARFGDLQFVGGLLGHWAVWTSKAVELLRTCKDPDLSAAELARLDMAVTDCNAAFFDAKNGYAGCIAGLHEVLRRQGLLAGIWCLDPDEGLSPGQAEEIDRVYARYPELNDDAFVAAHRDEWLKF